MKQTSHWLRVAAAVATLAIGAAQAVGASPAVADSLTVQSITPWLQNAAPVGWSATPNRVFYNSLGATGMWNGYSANSDGSNPVCLTCTIPSFPGVATATNRGISDVSPDGQYMLVTVERAIAGETASWTQPGKGGANDVYLYTTDGKQAWPLTNIYALGPGFALGSIWPRFDRTGTEIVWSSMLSPAILNLGVWELEVANIAWSGGVPSLANVSTIRPASNAFYEPYAFTPNDQGILFAGNPTGGSITGDKIDQIGVNGSGLTQVSPTARAGVANYAEFAFYTPDNKTIIFSRGYDTSAAGMDYWTMNPDGSNPQRLTYFNEPWSTESSGYSIAGSIAFNPANPNQFIAGVAHDHAAEHVNAVLVTLNSSTSSGGLTEQFFADPSFGQLVSTTTQDPSDGFKATVAPAAGVPSTNFSIRWGGGLTIPASGVYGLCSVAEFGDQIYLNATEVVNAKWSYGKWECATAAETAGSVVPIRLDYSHGYGDAYAQLAWIPPGSTSPVMIPSSDLTPATPPTVSTSIVLTTYGVKHG